MPTSAAEPTVASLFARINVEPDEGISRSEVKALLEKAGVGGGLTGGIKVNKAADAFMEQLDSDRNGKVTELEIQQKLVELLAKLPVAPGKSRPQLADEWFVKVDQSGDGAITVDEAKKEIAKQLRGQSMADMKAEIAAKVLVYLLDENGNKKADRSEVQSLALDIEARASAAV